MVVPRLKGGYSAREAITRLNTDPALGWGFWGLFSPLARRAEDLRDGPARAECRRVASEQQRDRTASCRCAQPGHSIRSTSGDSWDGVGRFSGTGNFVTWPTEIRAANMRGGVTEALCPQKHRQQRGAAGSRWISHAEIPREGVDD